MAAYEEFVYKSDFFDCVRGGDVDGVCEVLDSGGSVDMGEFETGETALHQILFCCTTEAHFEVLQLLMQRGADVLALTNVINGCQNL